MMKTLRILLTAVAIGFASPGTTSAAIPITSSGTTDASGYALDSTPFGQNFDTLPSSGTFTWANDSTLPGWSAANNTGGLNTAAVTLTGSGNAAALVLASVGTSGSSDRALSFHTQVDTAATHLGLAFTNNSGLELTSFTLAYSPEKWREVGSLTRNINVTVHYQVGATLSDLHATSGWTTIPGLDFSTESAVTSTTLTATGIPVSVPSGTSLWIRWVFSNTATTATNAHDILAIDNVTFSATGPAVDAAAVITTHPASQSVVDGTSVTFAAAASGYPVPAYQWFKGTSLISGATSPTYTIDPVAYTDAGDYKVTATNTVGSDTSNPATLTVTAAPLPPVIDTPPSGASVNVGQPVTFTVVAGGTGPFTYQWLKGSAEIPGAVAPSFTINPVATGDAGSYSVTVTNAGGSITSDPAVLTVIIPPSPPEILTPPASATVNSGLSVIFSVVAGGTGPFTYQWLKGTTPISGAVGTSLTINPVAAGDAGTYAVTVSNSIGPVTSAPASLTVTTPTAYSGYNLYGFATLGGGTTGGGEIAETNPAYRKCADELEFVTAIRDANKTLNAVKVIEITANLNLGWEEISAATKALTSNPIRSHATPKIHPTLIASGVSLLDISPKNGLTIFSANGSTIKHVTFNIKDCSNIIVRNLRFDEMWEWDEATKGDYDSNDWDFMVLSNGGTVQNVWIDHCTFTKAYDGIVDMKKGTENVTMSWCKYVGDDGATNPNSHVRQQIAALEANKSSYSFYNFLRTKGFSQEEVVQIVQGHDKGHLMGATSKASENNLLSATFHHQWFTNLWDRCVPRLRGGQVHNYNILVDDSTALVAKRLRDTRANAMSTTDKNTLNNTYSFNPFLNGSISTESGAILVEKSIYQDCITPLRNNQTDVNDPTFTGKIKSVDTIYIFHETNGSTTTVRGDSTDPGNPMGPFQATSIPFSWNTPGGASPYPAPPMDDPSVLPGILSQGAGAGTLGWSKDNWLKTAYVDSFPNITSHPASQTVNPGAAVAFSVTATGSGTLTYQWRRNNIPIDGATGPSLNLAAAQLSDAGAYEVLVTGSGGSVGSNPATLAVTDTFAAWSTRQGVSGATGDTDQDGIPNLVEFGLGLDPNQASIQGLPVTSIEGAQTVFRFTRPKNLSGLVYTVQSTTDLLDWSGTLATSVESSSTTTETLVAVIPPGQPRLCARLRIVNQP